MQNSTPHKQKGLTMISWMVVLIFLGFQGIFAINVIPVYMTDSTVKSIFEELANDSRMSDVNSAKIRETVIKRLKINSVYTLTQDDIKVKKERNDYIVSLEYEPRGKIIGSLDYIVTFKHEARISRSAKQ